MHFFGSERGAPGDADPVRHLPGDVDLRPLERADCRPRPRPSSSRSTPGPGGTPCPGAHAALLAALRRRRPPTTRPGAQPPFALDLARDDGDQNLTGLTVDDAARLPGHPARASPTARRRRSRSSALRSTRGSRELAARSARPASQVGTAVAGAGAGTRPLYVPGKVYLAGPYKGAPLSLVVVIPAVSGPYDLGNVAVRAAIHVDPVTAQVTATSDPLPQILEGIPLRTAVDPGQPRPPGLRAQPDQLRPAFGRGRRSPATKAALGPHRAASRSPTAPACPTNRS